MKILVISDSHGAKNLILRAFEHVSPDLTLHLGDHDADCCDLQRAYPDAKIRTVRGNCDMASRGLDTDTFTADGHRIFMTHGHLFSVKSGLATLIDNARARRAGIVLFGHTHNRYNAMNGGMYLINPGSIGADSKSFAVLTLEHGEVNCEIMDAKALQ